MQELNKLLEIGFPFHGHRCPAMPLGLRAGIAAMDALGTPRSQAHELHLISETGKGHAAGCFADGLMIATGCTYGKSNIEKIYHGKLAFTLIDLERHKSVRVHLKPEFVEKMLTSPFVMLRREGAKPQAIDADVADPLIQRVLEMPPEAFLAVGPVVDHPYELPPAVFDAARCEGCQEMVFIDKLVTDNGRRLCHRCAARKR